jgi:hypothetical protein
MEVAEVLTVKRFGQNEPHAVLDVDGNEIVMGGFVQTIKATTWLPKNTIVMVTGASAGVDDNVYYRDAEGSSSACKAKHVRVVNDPDVADKFELALLYNRLSSIDEAMSCLQGNRLAVTTRIRQLGGEV